MHDTDADSTLPRPEAQAPPARARFTPVAAALCGLAALGAPASTARASDVTVTIDERTRHQTIEGFGASGCWWPRYVADFPPAERRRMLELLFTDRGAALTIYRYNIPAGRGEDVVRRDRRTVDLEAAPGRYDYRRDAKAIGILREVRSLGVEHFVLFANSPPARMTRNGKVSGGDGGGSNLRGDMREAFATYLVDVAAHLKKTHDLPHVAISALNEPQWRWGQKWRGQEGCHYSPQEAAAMIKALVLAVRAAKLDAAVEAPESGSWKSSPPYAETMFADPVLNEAVDTFAVHSYWSNRQHKRQFVESFRRKHPTKRLAMTEYCQMKHGHDLSIDGGLHLANVLHDDLTVGSVVTWQWWLAIGPGGYRDALIYAHPTTRKIEPTKRLWTLANWSRFVRPGAVRVAAESSADDLRASAFLSKDGRELTCVVINNADEPVRARVEARAFGRARRSVHVTSARHDLARGTMARGGVTFPARSVSTLVLRGGG